MPTMHKFTEQDCATAIVWGPIRTHAPGRANDREGTCACEGRTWTQIEAGPGNTWRLREADRG